MIGTFLVILLIILLIGSFPRWKYNRHWGIYPFAGAVILFIVILFVWLIIRFL